LLPPLLLMEIHLITTLETLPLRQALLRAHLTEEECVYPGDNDASTVHLGAFIDNTLIGIASLYKKGLPEQEADDSYQFRALAIVQERRGAGCGLELLHAVEKMAMAKGAAFLWANARTSAIEFYRKAGYQIGEKEFIVAGVGPHVVISKKLGGQ